MVERTLTDPISNFGQEVFLIKQSSIEEERPWYLLPQTGFNVRIQIDQFEQDLECGRKLGKTAHEIIDEGFPKIEQDIQAFKIEYLCEGLLFPIVLDTKVINGQRRIVAPLYNHKLLVDTVSEQERNGQVKKSLFNVENFLLDAPPGSVAVMTSPDGWSGFDGITYQDTRTYIWRVMEDGRPMGFGVRTDMILDLNRQFLKAMGKDIPVSVSAKDQIVDIVASPVLIDVQPGQKPWQFEDVVNVIQNLKGSHFAYQNRLFDEIYQQLQNPQNLWTLDETTKRLTDELKTFFLNQLASGEYKRQDLEIALGITILKLARAIRKPTTEKYTGYNDWPTLPNNGPALAFTVYRSTLREVQSLPGCNGGGGYVSSAFIFTNTISPRLAEFGLNSSLCEQCGQAENHFHCPGCSGQIESGKGITKCPHCGLTKEKASSQCG